MTRLKLEPACPGSSCDGDCAVHAAEPVAEVTAEALERAYCSLYDNCTDRSLHAFGEAMRAFVRQTASLHSRLSQVERERDEIRRALHSSERANVVYFGERNAATSRAEALERALRDVCDAVTPGVLLDTIAAARKLLEVPNGSK